MVSERLLVPIAVCDSHDFRCQDEDRNSEAPGFIEVLIRRVWKGLGMGVGHGDDSLRKRSDPASLSELVRCRPILALEGAIRFHDEKRSAFGIPASIRSCC